jgi:type VI secretion system lysozyme-like protein
MSDPRVVDGASAPLFDRLVDAAPREPIEQEVFRYLTPEGLRASVRRELERLLDTRRPISLTDALNEDQLTVLEYGVPDYSSLNPNDLDECALFALAVRKAIAAFEPRLRNPAVEAKHSTERLGSLRLQIRGTIRLGPHVEEVWFPVDLGIRPSASPEV